MKLFGVKRLDQFAFRHPQFRGLLTSFRSIIVAATWKGQHEIPAAFKTAQKDDSVLFRLGQSCRIVAKIEYVTDKAITEATVQGISEGGAGAVIICKIWTHEEYNRHANDWWR